MHNPSLILHLIMLPLCLKTSWLFWTNQIYFDQVHLTNKSCQKCVTWQCRFTWQTFPLKVVSPDIISMSLGVLLHLQLSIVDSFTWLLLWMVTKAVRRFEAEQVRRMEAATAQPKTPPKARVCWPVQNELLTYWLIVALKAAAHKTPQYKEPPMNWNKACCCKLTCQGHLKRHCDACSRATDDSLWISQMLLWSNFTWVISLDQV